MKPATGTNTLSGTSLFQFIIYNSQQLVGPSFQLHTLLPSTIPFPPPFTIPFKPHLEIEVADTNKEITIII